MLVLLRAFSLFCDEIANSNTIAQSSLVFDGNSRRTFSFNTSRNIHILSCAVSDGDEISCFSVNSNSPCDSSLKTASPENCQELESLSSKLRPKNYSLVKASSIRPWPDQNGYRRIRNESFTRLCRYTQVLKAAVGDCCLS